MCRAHTAGYSYTLYILPEALYGVLVDTITAQTCMTWVSVCHAKKRAKKQGSIHPLRPCDPLNRPEPQTPQCQYVLGEEKQEYTGDVQRLKEPRCIKSIDRTHSPSQLRTSQRRGGKRRCDCDIGYITVPGSGTTNGKRTTSDSRNRFLKKER